MERLILLMNLWKVKVLSYHKYLSCNMNLKLRTLFINVPVVILCYLWTNPLSAQVRAWEEPIVIPTLKTGRPAEHPTFKPEIDLYADDDQIYPYCYQYRITGDYENKTYNGCFLENKYIKTLITPDIGGKVYGAIDKTDGYDFIYWQPTVKPALISLTGPWVSGGIEWNFPSGHRQTGYQTIGHRLTENPDGSKTVWVGETEWVHGLRWVAGVTAYPDKSLLEAKIRLTNPTSLPQSQYMWATAATHADSSYQLIYPTAYMTTHNRRSFNKWPVSGSTDLSWWKNIPNANSFFSEDPGGFFGGYDHLKQAGTVFVGNEHIMTGKKFWTWGASPSGRLWDWVLSDGGGPYVEPQAGAYTRNQPDFQWLYPGEVREFTLYFFPVKGIGAFKTANVNGALNLEFDHEQLKIGVYSTAEVKDGRITLSCKDKILFDRRFSTDPSIPFTIILPYKGEKKEAFLLSFEDEAGNILIQYSPSAETDYPMPEAEEPVKEPSAYRSADEIWNYGEYLYRNRDKTSAEIFFRHILGKDSLDIRANCSLAQLKIEQAEYQDALHLLDKAARRNRDNGRLCYLSGVADFLSGNFQRSYDSFYRSTHYQEYFSQGYQQVARIDLLNGKVKTAADHIRIALQKNSKSPDLLILQAICLRLLKEYQIAETACDSALSFDPMNFWALNEKIKLARLTGQSTLQDETLLKQLLLDDFQYYIELSLSYIEIGLFEDALEVYERFRTIKGNPATLIDYYEGYCHHQRKNTRLAKEFFEKGRGGSVDRIFPFRKQSIDVFTTALAYHPSDFNACYFLGLIYAGLLNGQKAWDNFEKASVLNPLNASVWRNMGLIKRGYPGVSKYLFSSRTCYEKAFSLAPDDDLILYEFDKVRMDLSESPRERLDLLKQSIPVVEQNDDLLTVMLDLMVAFGECEKAVEYFDHHVFNNREGKYGIHNSYMGAWIGLAEKTSDTEKALAYYQHADKYPDNLKVKPNSPNLRGFLYYPMALLHGQSGNTTEQERLLRITAEEHTDRPTLANYYQALALKKLDPGNTKSDQLIFALEQEGKSLLESGKSVHPGKPESFLNALGYYYLALVSLYEGNDELADTRMKKAQSIYFNVKKDATMLAQEEFTKRN